MGLLASFRSMHAILRHGFSLKFKAMLTWILSCILNNVLTLRNVFFTNRMCRKKSNQKVE